VADYVVELASDTGTLLGDGEASLILAFPLEP
jgi:hypothetical protein